MTDKYVNMLSSHNNYIAIESFEIAVIGWACLGNYVSMDYIDCKMKCRSFIGSVNKLLGKYGNVQHNVLCNLFNVYCSTFYGSQLWDLNFKSF